MAIENFLLATVVTFRIVYIPMTTSSRQKIPFINYPLPPIELGWRVANVSATPAMSELEDHTALADAQIALNLRSIAQQDALITLGEEALQHAAAASQISLVAPVEY